MSHEHAVTRSVRDCAALLDITTGPDVGAPYFTPKPETPFERLIETPPKQLRIGFITQTFDGKPVHGECAAAVERTAKLLTDMGHHVDAAGPDFDSSLLTDTMIRILFGSLVAMFPGDPGAEEEFGLEPITRAALAFARETTLAEHLTRTMVMNREVRKLSAFWERFDILVTPTMATPPVPLGTLDTRHDDLERFLETLSSVCPFTAPFNATGQPAISLPMHMTPDGLPVGVQFVGRFARDDTVLALAAALERAAPWARPPTVSASA